MLNLPLSNKTFTRGFLGGDGSVSIGLGGGAAFLPAQPFPDGTRTLVATQVAGDTPDLQFGGGAVTCEASFAVFDELIAIGGNGRAHRASALILEIVPPGGQPVTRMFMQGTKEAHT
jgi:hypothetical protein